MGGTRRGCCRCSCCCGSRVACSFWLVLLGAFLGFLCYSAADSARAYAAAEIYVNECRSLGQSPGGPCGWACTEVRGACEWCTSPPSIVGANRTCVGNPKGSAAPSWDPHPPSQPGQCSQAPRSGSCSQCQYESGNATAALFACAGAASIIAAAVMGPCCANCCLSTGCCVDLCLCCSACMGSGSLSLGIGGVLMFTEDCCRAGCKCCGRECVEPARWALPNEALGKEQEALGEKQEALGIEQQPLLGEQQSLL